MPKKMLLVTTMSEEAYQDLLDSKRFVSSDRSNAELVKAFLSKWNISQSDPFACCALYFDSVPSGAPTVAYGFRDGFHLGVVGYRIFLKNTVLERIKIGTIGDTVNIAKKYLDKKGKRPDSLLTFTDATDAQKQLMEFELYPESFYRSSYIELRIDGGIIHPDDIDEVKSLGTKLPGADPTKEDATDKKKADPSSDPA